MKMSLLKTRRITAGAIMVAMVMAVPARADAPSGEVVAAAQKLRRLDIMLMVTGLRCRNTTEDFQADFQAFEARHMDDLNPAARQLAADYAGRMGAIEAARAVDRLTVQMANQYGNGHPWLGCHDLKGLAQALAGQDGPEVLMQAADAVLDGDDRPAGFGGPVALAYAPVAPGAGPGQ